MTWALEFIEIQLDAVFCSDLIFMVSKSSVSIYVDFYQTKYQCKCWKKCAYVKKVYRLELQGPICAKYVYKTNDLWHKQVVLFNKDTVLCCQLRVLVHYAPARWIAMYSM